MVKYRRTISAAHLVGTDHWTYSEMRRVITYATVQLSHYQHIRLLRQMKRDGGYLLVDVSSEQHNACKGQKSYFSYEERKYMIDAIGYVALVINQHNWE